MCKVCLHLDDKTVLNSVIIIFEKKKKKIQNNWRRPTSLHWCSGACGDDIVPLTKQYDDCDLVALVVTILVLVMTMALTIVIKVAMTLMIVLVVMMTLMIAVFKVAMILRIADGDDE